MHLHAAVFYLIKAHVVFIMSFVSRNRCYMLGKILLVIGKSVVQESCGFFLVS